MFRVTLALYLAVWLLCSSTCLCGKPSAGRAEGEWGVTALPLKVLRIILERLSRNFVHQNKDYLFFFHTAGKSRIKIQKCHFWDIWHFHPDFLNLCYLKCLDSFSIQLLVFQHTPCCCRVSGRPRLYFEKDICECQWLLGILSKPESI